MYISAQMLNLSSFSDFNGSSIMNQIMIMYFIFFCCGGCCCVASQKITKLVAFLFDKHNVSVSVDVQLILFF